MSEERQQPHTPRDFERKRAEARAHLSGKKPSDDLGLDEFDVLDNELKEVDALKQEAHEELARYADTTTDEDRLAAKRALGGEAVSHRMPKSKELKLRKELADLEREALTRGRVFGEQMKGEDGVHRAPEPPTPTTAEHKRARLELGGDARKETREHDTPLPKPPTPEKQPKETPAKEKADNAKNRKSELESADKESSRAAEQDAPSEGLDTHRGRKLTLAQIALAEKARRKRDEENKYFHNMRKWQSFILGITIVFILIGTAVISFYAIVGPEQYVPPPPPEKTFLITVDERGTLTLGDADEQSARNAVSGFIANAGTPLGDVQGVTLKNGSELSAEDALRALAGTTPAALERTLGEEYMFGIYGGEAPAGFFILTVDSFDVAFSSMLTWENGGLSGLAPVLSGQTRGGSGQWHDALIKNVSVRLLRGTDNTISLIYSFVNKSTLIIAASKDAFTRVHSLYTSAAPTLQ